MKTNQPPSVILDCRDLTMAFKSAARHVIHGNNYKELLTQIFDCALNSSENLPKELKALPDFNRMYPEIPKEAQAFVRVETYLLACALIARLQEFHLADETSSSYIFECLLGNDIVLIHLPH